MLNTFYGIKQGQTQTYTANGVRIPVTEVLVEPLTVVQIKSADHDGYVALKVAFGQRNEKNISKPVMGELSRIKKYGVPARNASQSDAGGGSKNKDGNNSSETVEQLDSETVKSETVNSKKDEEKKDIKLPRYFREIRVKDSEEIKDIKPGDLIKVSDFFKEEDVIHVSGVGIGKGFAGGVKRWGFHGGPRTHGQSDRERAPGSIGQTTTPGRVYKGKHMAGRMGGTQVTVKNLKIVKIDDVRNVVLVKGLVPGKKKGVLIIYK